MDKLTKVIQLLEQAWRMEQQFLTEEPVEERDRPGTFERWSRKDTIAHIETWNELLAANLRASLSGEAPVDHGDIDAKNKDIFDAHHEKTWQEVYDFAARAHQSLIGAVRQLGNAGLERTGVLPWLEDQPAWQYIGGATFNHTLIHLGEYHRGRGDMGLYVSYLEQMCQLSNDLDDDPSWQGNVRYNLACVHALSGQKQRAIEELGDALRLNPRLIEWSRQDPDLTSLQGEPAYQDLVGRAIEPGTEP